MKISDTIKTPVRVLTVMKGSENDGMFLVDSTGHKLAELFNYGSDSCRAIARAINTQERLVEEVGRTIMQLNDQHNEAVLDGDAEKACIILNEINRLRALLAEAAGETETKETR